VAKNLIIEKQIFVLRNAPWLEHFDYNLHKKIISKVGNYEVDRMVSGPLTVQKVVPVSIKQLSALNLSMNRLPTTTFLPRTIRALSW